MQPSVRWGMMAISCLFYFGEGGLIIDPIFRFLLFCGEDMPKEMHLKLDRAKDDIKHRCGTPT